MNIMKTVLRKRWGRFFETKNAGCRRRQTFSIMASKTITQPRTFVQIMKSKVQQQNVVVF